MASKKRLRKKVDIKKKRSKLLKEKQKAQPAEAVSGDKKKLKTEKEEKLEIRLKKETKLYWIRAATGALSAFIGISIGLISWSLFIWMLAFWFGFPFFVSFVIFRYKYDKEEWSYKNILMPGIGIFFFLFMMVAIIIYTLLILS
jgi:hypothetical protein